MNTQSCADAGESPDPGRRLASGYIELTRIDEALRAAQQRLMAAHLLRARQQDAGRAELVYREILCLRDRSRRMLAELAEIWAADR
jgi:hypothetical protein